MGNHHKFTAYHRARECVVAAYRVTAGFPADERFGMTSQLRRAAISVTSNIAEGAAKRGKREFRRFLDIALGSIAECESLIEVATLLEMTDIAGLTELEAVRAEAGRVLWGLSVTMR